MVPINKLMILPLCASILLEDTECVTHTIKIEIHKHKTHLDDIKIGGLSKLYNTHKNRLPMSHVKV